MNNDDDDVDDAHSYRQDILHGDDEDIIANQAVPVHQDGFHWFQQKFSTHEEEVETGHQVTHTEDTDPATRNINDFYIA